MKSILEEYNEVTTKIKAKYYHLKFQKRKEILIEKFNA